MAFSLMMALSIAVIAGVGAGLGLEYFFGIVLPLAAVLVFIAGVVWRVIGWARAPVPFSIATTGGQQKSLPWIKPACLDAPYTSVGVIGRMVLEAVTFRSLFRNTAAEMRGEGDEPRLIYWSSKWLWAFGLLFHAAFFLVLFRHFRFFLEPVPFFIPWIENLDGLMQFGVPRFFMSDALLLAAVLFLLLRRLKDPKLRYISLPADYFPLFVLLGIIISGIALRYFAKSDVASIKVLTMGLVTLNPVLPEGVGTTFFVHLTFVSVLLIYLPFSKLMHMAGIFFSPTRNMPCNTRQYRHINPWNPPKKYRTYAEYEDEFREVMAEAGLPLEKQPEEEK